MSTELITLIAIAVFLGLVLGRAPIALALMTGSVLGIVLLSGWDRAAAVLASVPFTITANYALFVIPMYVLMGALIANSGLGTHIYALAHRFLGRLPGGLPAAAVAGTSVFSGISGSSAADIAAFGRISVAEMTRFGYRRSYAAAVVAAAGTFAVLIPPSIILVIYGILAEESIAALIIAALVPGLMSALVLITFVIFRDIVRPQGTKVATAGAQVTVPAQVAGMANREGSAVVTLDKDATVHSGGGPAGTSPDTGGLVSGGREQVVAVFYAFVIFSVVIGGVYAGFFTATEAGAVGATVALVIAAITIRFRPKELRRILGPSMKETSEITSMIFLLIIAGGVFSYFIASAQVPIAITEWVTALNVPPKVVVGLLLLALLPIGMVLDGLSTMLLFVPLTVPVVTQLGFDGIWWGILVIKMVEIGLITPPVGLNVFVASGVSNTKAEAIYKAVLPFVVLDLCFTATLFFVPDLILWLPRTAGLM